MEKFEQELVCHQKVSNDVTKLSTNLKTLQEQLLHSTWNNHRFVILITDKNLKSATMELEKYVSCMLNKNIMDGKT